MENLFISIVCIALLIIAATTMAMSALNSVSIVADAVNQQEDMLRDRLSSDISCMRSATTDNGTTLTVDLDNTGNASLANFSAWDVIVRYQDGSTQWIPYSVATPGWTVDSFFFQGGCGNPWTRNIQSGRNNAFENKISYCSYGEYN